LIVRFNSPVILESWFSKRKKVVSDLADSTAKRGGKKEFPYPFGMEK
jgi:hypothetical protein